MVAPRAHAERTSEQKVNATRSWPTVTNATIVTVGSGMEKRFGLDEPNYVRVAYDVAADHYWTSKHFVHGQDITDIKDCGWNNTLPARALRAHGFNGSFNAITVKKENVHGISIMKDSIYGSVLKFNAENKSCIKLVDFTELSRNLLDDCLRDQADCPFGISVATWIRFNPAELRRGEELPLLDMGEETGFKLYLKDRATHAQVVTGDTRWAAQAYSEHIFAKQWACVGFTWSAQHGIRVSLRHPQIVLAESNYICIF